MTHYLISTAALAMGAALALTARSAQAIVIPQCSGRIATIFVQDNGLIAGSIDSECLIRAGYAGPQGEIS